VPGSSQVGNDRILEMVGHLDFETILDVGPGRGQWYDLMHPWWPEARFVAVEIFMPYVERFNLGKRYDRVYCDDVRQWTVKNAGSYDLVIFGDVLEHMSKGEAVSVVESMLARHAVISIPIGVCPQEPSDDNPYEEHISTWYTEDVLAAFPQITTWFVEPENGMGQGIGRGVFVLEKK
jgi:hypothetical protein